jgi:crotonobetainyl-CoA:carnitine CoA-transferase CaiB-like acyl-CoA transferase
MAGGALEEVRVLGLTDDSGRFATKLLAEAGADVLEIATAPSTIDPDDRHLLDWWFDNRKRRLALDLDSERGQETFRKLASTADILIETASPGRLDRLRADYEDLRQLNTQLVHVSLTAFGRTGPHARWKANDLVSAALGGVLSVTGLPDSPLNGWGWQTYNTAGFFAAISALAALHEARRSGVGQHIDLSRHQAVVACTEQVLMQWFFHNRPFPEAIAPRQASLHWSAAYDVMACRTGHVMVSPTPTSSIPALMDLMESDGMIGNLREADLTDPARLVEILAGFMGQLRLWAATKDAHELFLQGQERHLCFGEVLTVAESVQAPQLRERGFFREAPDEGGAVTVLGPLTQMSGTPAPPPAAPEDVSAEAALAAWAKRGTVRSLAGTPGKRPLEGVRVLDFTWVLAGPYATRILGDLGADVVKIQTEARSQGANGPAFPYFVMWNRNKRGVTLDMKHPRASEVFRRLIEQADVVVENFSAGVLDRWSISYEQARQWNPNIIYLGMSGCGKSGPWKDFVTFAPSVQALSGITYLTNPPGRRDIGYGFALTDHLSGLAGALAVTEALEARRRTGAGQFIDLSQLEVAAYLVGPAYVQYLNTGADPVPVGNADPFADNVPNDVYRCRDGEWLAVAATSDDEWTALAGVIGCSDEQFGTLAGRRQARAAVDAAVARWASEQDAHEAMSILQAAGVPAGAVQNARDLCERDPQLSARDWLREVESPLLGPHLLDRFPAEFSASELSYQRTPLLGEHNFEVYEELLGMSEAEVAEAIGDGLFS